MKWGLAYLPPWEGKWQDPLVLSHPCPEVKSIVHYRRGPRWLTSGLRTGPILLVWNIILIIAITGGRSARDPRQTDTPPAGLGQISSSGVKQNIFSAQSRGHIASCPGEGISRVARLTACFPPSSFLPSCPNISKTLTHTEDKTYNLHTYTHTQRRKHPHMSTHSHTPTHAHTHTHTHTYTQSSQVLSVGLAEKAGLWKKNVREWPT